MSASNIMPEKYQNMKVWHCHSLWLSLKQIAELFGRDKSVIYRHLRNVFKEDELDRSSVVAKNATTAADGGLPSKFSIVQCY